MTDTILSELLRLGFMKADNTQPATIFFGYYPQNIWFLKFNTHIIFVPVRNGILYNSKLAESWEIETSCDIEDTLKYWNVEYKAKEVTK